MQRNGQGNSRVSTQLNYKQSWLSTNLIAVIVTIVGEVALAVAAAPVIVTGGAVVIAIVALSEALVLAIGAATNADTYYGCSVWYCNNN